MIAQLGLGRGVVRLGGEPGDEVRCILARIEATRDPVLEIGRIIVPRPRRFGHLAHELPLAERRIARHAIDVAAPCRGRRLAEHVPRADDVVGVDPSTPTRRHRLDGRRLQTQLDRPRRMNAFFGNQVELHDNRTVRLAVQLHRIAVLSVYPTAVRVRRVAETARVRTDPTVGQKVVERHAVTLHAPALEDTARTGGNRTRRIAPDRVAAGVEEGRIPLLDRDLERDRPRCLRQVERKDDQSVLLDAPRATCAAEPRAGRGRRRPGERAAGRSRDARQRDRTRQDLLAVRPDRRRQAVHAERIAPPDDLDRTALRPHGRKARQEDVGRSDGRVEPRIVRVDEVLDERRHRSTCGRQGGTVRTVREHGPLRNDRLGYHLSVSAESGATAIERTNAVGSIQRMPKTYRIRRIAPGTGVSVAQGVLPYAPRLMRRPW